MTADSVTRPRRLKREDLSQVPAKAEEIAAQNCQQRRHPEPPVVVAVHAPYVSKRGLLHDMYFARCGECGLHRRYQSAGFRICPCGARYTIVIGAVVGAPAVVAA